jgi:hypothetical protein
VGGQFGLVQLDGSQAYQQGLVHALILKAVKVKVPPLGSRAMLVASLWSATRATVSSTRAPLLRGATRPQPLALLIRAFTGTSWLEFKYCQQEGCEIRAVFGSKEDKVSRFCKEHKDEDPVDVASKKCEHEGCESTPVYGSREDGIRRLCIRHKGVHHVDVVNREMCRHEGCEIVPVFGQQGGQDTALLQGPQGALACRREEQELHGGGMREAASVRPRAARPSALVFTSLPTRLCQSD